MISVNNTHVNTKLNFQIKKEANPGGWHLKILLMK